MPEARITLAQATTYLASTVKSNASYQGINEALSYVKSSPALNVPHHLKSSPDKDHPEQYRYPHSYPDQWVDQQYSPNHTPQFYFPKDVGVEEKIKRRLTTLWREKKTYE